jgi:hypothetical protein
MAPQAAEYPKPSREMWQISGGMTPLPMPAEERSRGAEKGFKLASWITSKLMVQYENLRYQKLAMIKALPMQFLHNFYLLMASCEINDATYIVDTARTEGYK